MKKTGLLVQARMTSSRFPGKVLEDLHGKPMIVRVIERVRLCRLAGRACVVTSSDPSDDPLCRVLESHAIPYFRGSLLDVLDRYYRAAREMGLSTVVRVTGDCPLIDSRWVDRQIERMEAGAYDAVFSADSVPDGFRAHVVSFTVLETAFRQARQESEREHVVPYLWNNPEKFRLFYEAYPQNLSRYHLSVDRSQDLELVRALYGRLYDRNPAFTLEDVIALLESETTLLSLNARAKQ